MAKPPLHAFSLKIAHAAAQLSDAAYLPFERGETALGEFKSALEKLGFKYVDHVAVSKSVKVFSKVDAVDSQAFCADAAGGSARFIAYRGTEPTDPVDWITDLRITREKVADGIKIHDGFLSAYRPEVEKKTLQWRAAFDGPTILAGHSLGGALANLATVLMKDNPPDACYTFGQPRIGKVEPEHIGAPVFRFVNDRDIVPRVPLPLNFVLSYRDIGTEYHLDSEGRVTEIAGRDIGDQLNERLSWLKDIMTAAMFRDTAKLRGLLVEPAKDHGRAGYVERLAALQVRRDDS